MPSDGNIALERLMMANLGNLILEGPLVANLDSCLKIVVWWPFRATLRKLVWKCPLVANLCNFA